MTAGNFLRNCWYVAAWDHEITADALFRRVVIGEPILLYRLAGGAVVALEDRCCHRHAPLSRGRREGDCVRCGYHGLKFDARLMRSGANYFFQEAHRADAGNESTTRALFDGLLAAFEEDRATISAQARNIALDPERPMLPLMMDKALVQFRRLFETQLAAEHGEG